MNYDAIQYVEAVKPISEFAGDVGVNIFFKEGEDRSVFLSTSNFELAEKVRSFIASKIHQRYVGLYSLPVTSAVIAVFLLS